MTTIHRPAFRRATIFFTLAAALVLAGTPALAQKSFEGRWTFTVTIPTSPDSKDKRTFNLDIDALSRDGSLHARMTITDAEGRTVGGVWRKDGKKVSITFELPCLEGETCATLVLKGKMKKGFTVIKKGDVIVMWDTENEQDPALFDTSNGSFSGARVQ
jgi:hypothetical protein